MIIPACFLMAVGALGFCASFAYADAWNVMLLPGWILLGLCGGLLLPWNRRRHEDTIPPHQSLLLFDRDNVSYLYVVFIFLIVLSGLAVFIGLHSLNAAHPVMLAVISGLAIAIWMFVTYGMWVERNNDHMAFWFALVGRVLILGIVAYSLHALFYSIAPVLIGTAMVVRNHRLDWVEFWLPALSATYTYGISLALLIYVIRFEAIHATVSDWLRQYLVSRTWWPHDPTPDNDPPRN